jgi:uncharacterized Fe-S cluster-containing radical SAM superfamily protein
MKVKRLSLEIFGGCNFVCQMCPQGEGGRETSFLRSMPFELFKDIVIDAKQHGVQVINIEGSGEATLNKDINKYIDFISQHGIKPILYTNGFLVKGNLMKKLFDSGLFFCRFSVVGYNKEVYKEWMRKDSFDRVLKNAISAKEYVEKNNYESYIGSYHLIINNDNQEYEIDEYKKNFISKVGSVAEIWKMHNWSGTINRNDRQGFISTCGRPFSPDLTIRAGGLDGKHGAVVPCCQTMGDPLESTSVLGHLQDNTIEEVFNGDAYENLRNAHRTGDFSTVPYCNECDFLIQDPEVLVYTNRPDIVSVGNMRATDISLRDYIVDRGKDV